MLNDDDLVVIIVGDDAVSDLKSSTLDSTSNLAIKEEDLSENEELNYLNLIDIKVESLDSDNEKMYIKNDSNECESENEHTLNSNKNKSNNNASETLLIKLRKKYGDECDSDELIVKELISMMEKEIPALPPSNYVNHTNMGYYSCSVCNKKSQTEPQAQRHYQERHGPHYLECYVCGKVFRSKTNLYKHEKKNCSGIDHELVLKARAIYIGGKAKNRPFLQFAKKKFYKKKYNIPKSEFARRYCPKCPASFTKKYELISHLAIHDGHRPYLCHLCPSAYVNATSFARHLTSHSKPSFICDHCGASFNGKMNLIAHLDTHLKVKKFKCTHCDQRYASKYSMNLHIDSKHKNLTPPLACDVCEKRFWKINVLKLHMNKLHGLSIMTSRMFYRLLPKMSGDELKEKGTLVLGQINTS